MLLYITQTQMISHDDELFYRFSSTLNCLLQKSDGGYGYDSTDMAALHYRTHELLREWIVIITDAGQAPHFHMCFEAAKAAGWVDNVRLDHIGFGVVCGVW